MKKLVINIFGLTALLLTFAPVQAEVIEVPVGSQQNAQLDISLPRTGTNAESVEKAFGKPLVVGAAVGEPPISRWEYADYYVYFEYDHVIHSVIKHRPKNLDQ